MKTTTTTTHTDRPLALKLGWPQPGGHRMRALPAPLAGKRHSLLQQILTSRVYDVAKETPLEPAPRLSRRLGCSVLLKREDLQPVWSFKLRGAYNKISQLSPAERAKG